MIPSANHCLRNIAEIAGVHYTHGNEPETRDLPALAVYRQATNKVPRQPSDAAAAATTAVADVVWQVEKRKTLQPVRNHFQHFLVLSSRLGTVTDPGRGEATSAARGYSESLVRTLPSICPLIIAPPPEPIMIRARRD